MNIEYRENTLTAEEYLVIERQMGDPMTTKEQAERAIAHQLFSITALVDNQMVGIARLIGDGAIYWYINDVWVLPQYQGKGIGSSMVQREKRDSMKDWDFLSAQVNGKVQEWSWS